MMNESMEHNQAQVCPQCDNHCPIDALQCGRGRRYFGVADGGPDHDHAHDDSRGRDHAHDGGRGHDHDHDGHHHHGGRGGGHHKHGGRGR